MSSDDPVGIADGTATAARAKTVLRELDRATASGHRLSEVFRDFLDVTESALRAIPVVAQAVAAGRQPPVIDADLCIRVHGRYGDTGYRHLQRAFAGLFEASADGIHDVIGTVYMDGEMGGHHGQFFTPMPVAWLMAMTSIPPAVADLKDRLYAAIKDSPVASAAVLTGAAFGDHGHAFALDALRPFIDIVEPIAVHDPACGSGVMLLAAAAAAPEWVRGLGLMTFSGTDLDPVCVQMCRVNCLLYGLGGGRGIAMEDALAA